MFKPDLQSFSELLELMVCSEAQNEVYKASGAKFQLLGFV